MLKLIHYVSRFKLCADFDAYIKCQDKVSEMYTVSGSFDEIANLSYISKYNWGYSISVISKFWHHRRCIVISYHF